MGVCLSCLGLGSSSNQEDRARLLYSNDPYAQPQGYGTWGGLNNGIAHPAPQDLMSAAEVKREQAALDTITRWARDQIVEIFPQHVDQRFLQSSQRTFHQPLQNQYQKQRQQQSQGSQAAEPDSPTDSRSASPDQQNPTRQQQQSHTDILLHLVPGDKSKRSIRIYAPSRPSSRQRDADSIRSKSSHAYSKGSMRSMNSKKSAHGTEQDGDGKLGPVMVKFNVDLP